MVEKIFVKKHKYHNRIKQKRDIKAPESPKINSIILAYKRSRSVKIGCKMTFKNKVCGKAVRNYLYSRQKWKPFRCHCGGRCEHCVAQSEPISGLVSPLSTTTVFLDLHLLSQNVGSQIDSDLIFCSTPPSY